MQLTTSRNNKSRVPRMVKGKAKTGTIRKSLSRENSTLLEKPDTSPSTHGRIAQVFLNVDMRNYHEGLLDIAGKGLKTQGVDIRKFPAQCYLVFINEKGNRFKLMTPARHTEDGYVIDWLIAFYKAPQGRITPELIYNIPKIFSGNGQLQLVSSGKEYLQEELRMKRIRSVGPK